MMRKEEKLGEIFNLDKLLKARELTASVVNEVASHVFLGMTENDGHELIDKTLEKYGASKKWHPNKFRIGADTTKSFREKSEEGTTLQEGDIFFIDIGPVFDGHEGDFGRTFIFGQSEKYEKIIDACNEVFEKTAAAHEINRLSGIRLYKYASEVAENLGYVLNHKMNGHRLGDFPHALYSKDKLGEMDFAPKENIWVLEILIKHPIEDFGAFYEDLL